MRCKYRLDQFSHAFAALARDGHKQHKWHIPRLTKKNSNNKKSTRQAAKPGGEKILLKIHFTKQMRAALAPRVFQSGWRVFRWLPVCSGYPMTAPGSPVEYPAIGVGRRQDCGASHV